MVVHVVVVKTTTKEKDRRRPPLEAGTKTQEETSLARSTTMTKKRNGHKLSIINQRVHELLKENQFKNEV